MKLMIASDIHGSAPCCRLLLERFREEKADRLLLLGDYLYHGPRNDLPDGYDPKETARLLNGARDRLLCIRGNCDAEVDQMVLTFPVMADYAVLPVGGRVLYAVHGHIFGESNPPPLCAGDLLLCGHTHVPACEEHERFVYLNPGSVSIPKQGSCRSYMTLEDSLFIWKDLADGKVTRRYAAGPLQTD